MSDILLIEAQAAAARSSASAHVHAQDLAGRPAGDSPRAAAGNCRRVLTCLPLPQRATPQVCVAAWHAVLHWLQPGEVPMVTCQVGRWARACWVCETTAGPETSLAQLLAATTEQWQMPHGDWLDLDEPAHASLAALLRHQAIRLEPGPEDTVAELALVHAGDRWQLACAASRYGESDHESLLARWQQFVAALLHNPQARLCEAAASRNRQALGASSPGGRTSGPAAAALSEPERAYWGAQCAQPSVRLRFDRPEAADAAPLEATTAEVKVVLDTNSTHLLMQGSQLRRGIHPQHLLVASLGHALGRWLEVDVIRIDLERDGRGALPGACESEAAEFGRTVGRLTVRHPLVLDDLRADLATLVDRTRAHLDAVPHRGLGYGTLRLRPQDGAGVLFSDVSESDAAVAVGRRTSPNRRRTHALCVQAQLRDGHLALRFDYSRQQFAYATIAALAAQNLQALRDVVGCCSAGRRAGVDWPGAGRPVRDVTAPAPGASGSPRSWAG